MLQNNYPNQNEYGSDQNRQIGVRCSLKAFLWPVEGLLCLRMFNFVLILSMKEMPKQSVVLDYVELLLWAMFCLFLLWQIFKFQMWRVYFVNQQCNKTWEFWEILTHQANRLSEICSYRIGASFERLGHILIYTVRLIKQRIRPFRRHDFANNCHQGRIHMEVETNERFQHRNPLLVTPFWPHSFWLKNRDNNSNFKSENGFTGSGAPLANEMDRLLMNCEDSSISRDYRSCDKRDKRT